MSRIIRRETRKRGFFGWLFLLLFFAFNAFMLYALAGGFANVASTPSPTDSASQAGRAIGIAMGSGFLIFIWVAGAVILGLFALLTRGRRTIIEETTEA